MGPTLPLGDNSGVPKHASWFLQHVTACETTDALQEIHDHKGQLHSDLLTSEKCDSASPFVKKTYWENHNLKGPGVASLRLQLCGIASTAHLPVCTSRRENAFVATGCFNIYSAVSDWCCAEYSQMCVSLSQGFFFFFFSPPADAELSAS